MKQRNRLPTYLLAFLGVIAPRTKSLLLATATPVQMYPVEAWDLLSVLAIGNNAVLGTDWSNWRRANDALAMAMGQAELPEDDQDRWRWIRNPLPSGSEAIDFKNIRRTLKVSDAVAVVPGDAWNKLRQPDKDRIRR